PRDSRQRSSQTPSDRRRKPLPFRGSGARLRRDSSPVDLVRYGRIMPVALVTGAARANSIAAGIVPRLRADGWDVVTSDLNAGDYPCDLSDAEAPTALVERVSRERGSLSALVLSHAHDV